MTTQLTDGDKQQLLALARAGVESQVRRQPAPAVDDPTGLLAEQRGCFVTLTNAGRLRGCIGTFSPRGPLGPQVVEMGRSAAADPRFVGDPITPAELEQIHVEVSLLTPLRPASDPLGEIEIGRTGIYIQQGPRSGCFLPEVATDQGWDAEEFLQYCCSHKAGLAPNAWKDPETKVLVFESEKFGQQ